jgi:hypothetical protein
MTCMKSRDGQPATAAEGAHACRHARSLPLPTTVSDHGVTLLADYTKIVMVIADESVAPRKAAVFPESNTIGRAIQDPTSAPCEGKRRHHTMCAAYNPWMFCVWRPLCFCCAAEMRAAVVCPSLRQDSFHNLAGDVTREAADICMSR